MALITKPRAIMTATVLGLVGAAYSIAMKDSDDESEATASAQTETFRRGEGEFLPPPVSDQVAQARQRIFAEQGKKGDGFAWTSWGAPETVPGDCSAAKIKIAQKAQDLMNKAEGTKASLPATFCPQNGIDFKVNSDRAQVQGFLADEASIALTPRFFESHWTPCDRATVLYGLAQCQESGECDAFEYHGANFFPGGEVGQKAADFNERCEAPKEEENLVGGSIDLEPHFEPAPTTGSGNL